MWCLDSDQSSVERIGSKSTNMEVRVISVVSLTLTVIMLLTTPASSAPQYQQSLFGASNPAPCCRWEEPTHTSLLSLLFRSNFPEEFGSCQANEHCSQPTAPYCSAFGYCTQVRHLLDTFRVMWRRDRSRGTDTMDVSPVNNTQPTRINKPEIKLNVNTSILYLFLYLIKIHNRLQLSY